ncbi:unnamed protein product [Ceratitis capitata]|uniref:(Mediterranean fruit fly) hypothetical protein n=1 Tax=Ceratitis capitata TaxID=7213 RepID=A0A811V2T8_CERCA|nr:unnamed protein product [Ceratitis capitata]
MVAEVAEVVMAVAAVAATVNAFVAAIVIKIVVVVVVGIVAVVFVVLFECFLLQKIMQEMHTGENTHEYAHTWNKHGYTYVQQKPTLKSANEYLSVGVHAYVLHTCIYAHTYVCECYKQVLVARKGLAYRVCVCTHLKCKTFTSVGTRY